MSLNVLSSLSLSSPPPSLFLSLSRYLFPPPCIRKIIHIINPFLPVLCRDGFFAAASCMSFQQCRFNFGSEPFKYPPKSRAFDSFNSHAYLKEQDKIVLPRHLFLEQLRKLSVREDSCTLCFDLKGIVRLEPCMHRFDTNEISSQHQINNFLFYFPFSEVFV